MYLYPIDPTADTVIEITLGRYSPLVNTSISNLLRVCAVCFIISCEYKNKLYYSIINGGYECTIYLIIPVIIIPANVSKRGELQSKIKPR